MGPGVRDPVAVSAPARLVLDFYGVVCQGMREFFESSWRAWQRVGRAPLPATRREELAARFAHLRPVVESGWEMAMLPALLAARDPVRDAELEDEARWATVRGDFLDDHQLTSRELADALDGARDAWLAEDRDGWVAAHEFYPGIADWLRRLIATGPPTFVLSTKDKRFLDALLRAHAVPIPDERVIGKATPRRAKWEVIQQIAAGQALPADGSGVWFVEDRFATLLELRRDAPQLAAMQLFLAEWGYVFPRDIARARASDIATLSLTRATGPFAEWVS
jgi:phosphoglycolate phosphatase-like HAD superfamily hydrolase